MGENGWFYLFLNAIVNCDKLKTKFWFWFRYFEIILIWFDDVDAIYNLTERDKNILL